MTLYLIQNTDESGTLDQDVVLEEGYVGSNFEIGSISVATPQGAPTTLTLDAGYSITFMDYPSFASDYQAMAGSYNPNNGNPYGSTFNNYGTVSGGGTIYIGGDNSAGLIFNNESTGVVDATGVYALDFFNFAGNNPNDTVEYIDNQGLMEDTGSGGLEINGLVYNEGGTILANGTGTSVTFSGAYLFGGTLQSENGGVIVVDYNTDFDGSSQTAGGAITIAQGTTVNDTDELQLVANPNAIDSIINNGLLNVDQGTILSITDADADGNGGGTVQFTGGGTISLLGGAIDGVSPSTLDNVDNTISGYGSINSVRVINEADGVIDANSTNSLQITSNSSLTNKGLLEATGTGGLILNDTIYNDGGLILADGTGAVVLINPVTYIYGGTLQSENGGVIDVGYNDSIDGTNSTGQGAVTIAQGTTVDDTDEMQLVANPNFVNSIINEALIKVEHGAAISISDANGNGTGGGTVQFTGGGTISLLGGAINGVSPSILDNVDNTISGYGSINSLHVINEAGGVIDANAASSLQITGNSPLTNKGLLEATGTSELILNDTIYNDGGTILANGTGAVVLINPVTYIYGGTIQSENGGVIDIGYNDSIDGTNSTGQGAVTIAQGTTIDDTDATQLVATSTSVASIINEGLIEVENNSNISISDVNGTSGGTVQFTGGGTISLLGGYIYGGSSNVLDDVNNVISGYGTIETVAVVNEADALIDANAANALTLASSVTNLSTVEATNGGNLAITGTVDNTDAGANNGGVILADGGTVTIENGIIIGGAIEAEDGGSYQVIYGTLNGSQSNDPLTIQSGVTLDTTFVTLKGTIVNDGTIDLASGGLAVNGSATLQGSGSVVMADGQGSIAQMQGSGLDLQQEVTGEGHIYISGTSALTNESVIDATTSKSLTISADYAQGQSNSSSNTLANLGVLEATGTGGLYLSSVIIDNTQNGNAGEVIAGTPAIQGDPQVILQSNVDIKGGTLISYAGDSFVVDGDNDLLDGSSAAVTIASGTNLTVASSDSLELKGSIVNRGTINAVGNLLIGASSSDADATASLSGGGAINLSLLFSSTDMSSGASVTLDNVDNTISGSGQIEVGTLINEASGTIDATTGYLTINASAITNAGLLESTGATSVLDLGDTTITNQGGQISADGSGAEIELNNDIGITGGSLSALDGGSIQVFGNSTTAVEISAAVTVGAGSVLSDQSPGAVDMTGSVVNDGTIIDDGTFYFGLASASPDMSLGALSGTGTVEITGSSSLELTGSSASDETIAFENSSAFTTALQLETLQIDSSNIGASLDFASSISGMALGDVIDLANLSGETGYTFDGTTLTVDFMSGQTASLKLTGLDAQTQFNFTSFGQNGTSITLDEPVTIAYYLTNEDVFNALPGGVSVADTAANVSANIALLNGTPNITSVALTDGGTPSLTLSLDEALNDQTALGKITGSYTITIDDTANNIQNLTSAEIDNLQSVGVTQITTADTIIELSVAQASELATDNIAVSTANGFILVADTAANIDAISVSQIDQLQSLGIVEVASSDTSLQLSIAQAQEFIADNIFVATPSGDSISILDTASNIESLSGPQIDQLVSLGITQIVSDDAPIQLSVEQAAELIIDGISLAAPQGDTISIADSASNLEMLSATQIDQLAALGVTQFVSTDAPLQFTLDQATALSAGNITASAPQGILLSDSTATLLALTPSQLDGLKADGFTGLVIDDTIADLSTLSSQDWATLNSDEAALGGNGLTVADTASDILTYAPGDISLLAGNGVTAIDSTDGSAGLTVAEAFSFLNAGIAFGSSTAFISDTAANLLALSQQQVASLRSGGLDFLNVVDTISDIDALTPPQLATLQSDEDTLANSQISLSLLVTDSVANIKALSVSAIDTLAERGVVGIVTPDALALSVAQTNELAAHNIFVDAVAGFTVQDTAEQIETLTPQQISLLNSINVTPIQSTNGSLTFNIDQANAFANGSFSFTVPAGDTVSVEGTNADLASLVGGELAVLSNDGVNKITSTDTTDITFTAAEAEVLSATQISTSQPLIVLDTAANIEALSSSAIGVLASSDGVTLASTDGPLQLSVQQVQALEEGGNTGTAQGPGNDGASVYDTAANIGEVGGNGVEGLTADQIADLPLVFIQSITAYDAPLQLTVAQVEAADSNHIAISDLLGISVADSAASVSSDFDFLNSDSWIGAITLTDQGVPNLTLTAQQIQDDTAALSKITNTDYTIDGVAACYCPGTMIATEDGERPIEALAIGDRVRAHSGGLRRIKWIGRRSYGGRFIMGRKAVLPICIKAGALGRHALGGETPRRDLWVSPHHAMLIDSVLIEAQELLNGISIIQAKHADEVTYVHIELESHDAILAEGAWSESFIDDNNRGIFHNAHEYADLYPNEEASAARYYAPRLDSGFEIDRIRQNIAAIAKFAVQREKAGTLRGFIDLIGERNVCGWAQDHAYPEIPVQLAIYDGDNLLGHALADLYRADLEAAGLGSGKHAFSFTLLHPMRTMPQNIRVVRLSDGSRLNLTEKATAALHAAETARLHMQGQRLPSKAPRMTSSARRLIMQTAHRKRRALGLTMSAAMQSAWAEFKARQITMPCERLEDMAA